MEWVFLPMILGLCAFSYIRGYKAAKMDCEETKEEVLDMESRISKIEKTVYEEK